MIYNLTLLPVYESEIDMIGLYAICQPHLVKNIVVVQVNGKKRGLIETENLLDEKRLREEIKKNQELDKFIIGKNIMKTIFIKNKLINFIIK